MGQFWGFEWWLKEHSPCCECSSNGQQSSPKGLQQELGSTLELRLQQGGEEVVWGTPPSCSELAQTNCSWEKPFHTATAESLQMLQQPGVILTHWHTKTNQPKQNKNQVKIAVDIRITTPRVWLLKRDLDHNLNEVLEAFAFHWGWPISAPPGGVSRLDKHRASSRACSSPAEMGKGRCPVQVMNHKWPALFLPLQAGQ